MVTKNKIIIITISVCALIVGTMEFAIPVQDAYGQVTSSQVTYSATQNGNTYIYTLDLKNTSPAGYDVYAGIFGQQYNVPMTSPLPLQNIVLKIAPNGWNGYSSNYIINYFGSGPVQDYIKAGNSATFVFTSTTPPPPSLPFGAVYYNNAGQGGFLTTAMLTL